MDIEQIKSELKMVNFYFSEANVSRSSAVSDGAYNADIKKEVKKIEEHKYDIILTLIITKEDLNLLVKANATFILETNDYAKEETLINANTVAIMFPFIRSQVSLLTTQPGMSPIILPPINTAKFLMTQENNV